MEAIFRKGTDPGIDSYSGFFDNGHRKATGMGDYLKGRGVDEVHVVGLAGDYCIAFAALVAPALVSAFAQATADIVRGPIPPLAKGGWGDLPLQDTCQSNGVSSVNSEDPNLPSASLDHPVLHHGLDPSRLPELQAACEPALAVSDADLVALIPGKPFATYCECPACYGGVEGNHVFRWTVEDPDRMTCRFCGTVYPNDRYPERETLTGANPLGEPVTYAYYHNPERDVAHFLSAHLGRYRRQWAVDRALDLAGAYHLTGDERYARPVVLLLNRAARVYPHYPVIQTLPRRFAFRESQAPPYAWDSGRWGWFHNEVPGHLVRAYDLVYLSAWFDRLSEESGRNVRERVEGDFFRPAFRAAAAYPDYVMNAIGPGYNLTDAALLGRVIAEPRFVHWSWNWLKRILQEGFFADGMWRESPSYHYMTVGGLRGAFQAVSGYSDPAGYVDPVDGLRFDALDPASDLPFWKRVQEAPTVVGFPNGCTSPVHDTHPGERRADAREETRSAILPAFGHASLGRGNGPHQMEAQLHFSGAHGHHHLDCLNLTLWACEREMLPDLGYTLTQLRHWATSTLGHNLVVVDRESQGGQPADGALLSYFPDSAGVGVVEADGRRSYANIAGMERYRRMLVTVPVSGTDAYVIDLFRVCGGHVHDWTVQADADEDTAAEASVRLSGAEKWLLEEGEEWVEPQLEWHAHNPYGMVREVDRGPAGDGCLVRFTYGGPRPRGLNLHLLPSGPAEVLLGRSPSVRRAGRGSEGDMRRVYDFWMPKLLLRREGPAPLSSTFCSVFEPFVEEPFLAWAERVPLRPAVEGCVALRVQHGDLEDTIISTLDEPPYPVRQTADGVSLRGRLGIVRRRDSAVTGLWLFEGTELSVSGSRIASPTGAYGGTLVSSVRDAEGAGATGLVADCELPSGDLLSGNWLTVVHPDGNSLGCQIDRIERRGRQALIHLSHDPGLAIAPEACREVHFPQRVFPGPTRFRIPTSTVLPGSR